MTSTAHAVSSRSARAFGLVDAMVLIAATAVGFASYRVCKDSWAGLGGIPLFRNSNTWLIAFLYRATTWASLWLVPWTVALLLLSLRRPRAPLRLLARQPGFVATVASTLLFALGAAEIFLVLAVRYLPTWRLGFLAFFLRPLFLHCAFDLQLPTLMGAAVAGSWLVLFLNGRWRPGRNWLDGLGRALGYCWVALFLISAFLGPWFYLSNHFHVPPNALRAGVR
ncbi:hypothetical protein [Singulisphaera acidiphila]|uniref:Uncharacterized protein n=1 Tax=Singulisphaera acidiphila (strain ATCC BAA-1392 / DSM 18658 / VKM B-2454 / MOB10) TaxID=886293 RepID=L0DIG7_SINAD|nr:hypothetical protein [Singulisphaera acidiphila]AGA28431.1 hypothetical protein Sinac_4228 [Singulisphaera acidiphila DSM 18658]